MNSFIKRASTVLLTLIVLVSGSCAHKSGQRREDARPRTSSENTRNTTVRTVTHEKRSGTRSTEKLEGTQIFARYESAVFMVYTSDGKYIYQGSGFFIDNNGLAVSNYHVFKGTDIDMAAIKLSDSDDNYYNVTRIIAENEDEDFIIFRVNAENTNYIPVAADKPQVGEKVYAIGSPRGNENTFSSGDVSQWRSQNYMQISVPIDNGSSGGALINEYGEVVGIASAAVDGTQANLNFAWSIDVIKPYID